MGEVSEEPVVIYSEGIITASVCTSLTNEETEAYLRGQSGISSDWTVSEDEYFRGGKVKNGGPCDREPDTRRHLLMHC